MSEPVTVYRCQHCWSAEPMVGHGEWRALPAAEFDARTARLAAVERELDEARALLRDLAESDLRCPDCGHAQHDDEQGKHHPGCRIDALLRGGEVKP